jgi:hypothetical protein
MNFLPFESIVIHTSLAPDEVRQYLEKVTRFANLELPQSDCESGTELFAGRLSQDSFKLKRVLPFRSVLFPIIRGSIRATASGSRVRLTLHPCGWGWGITALWLWLIAIASLITLTASTSDFAQMRIWLTLLVLGYLGFIAGFKVEVQNVRAILSHLLSPSHPDR